MKRSILYYNRLVKRYNKYQRKLERAKSSSYHYRRIDVLLKRIKSLYQRIQELGMALKAATAGSAIAAAMMLAPLATNAQEFTLQTSIPTGISHAENFAAPTFADIDADGDLDLVVGERYGNRNGGLYVWTNEDGDFTWNTSHGVSAIWTQIDSVHNRPDADNGGAYIAPAFIDQDGDGDLDLFVGQNDGNPDEADGPAYDRIRYFENDAGQYVEKFGVDNPLIGFTDGALTKPTFADLDGDGDLDAVIGKANGELQYWQSSPSPVTTASSIEVYGSVDDDGTGLAWEYTGSWASKQGDAWVNGALECTNGDTLNATSTCPYPINPVTGNTSSNALAFQGILSLQNDIDQDGVSSGADNRDRAIHLKAYQDIPDLSVFALGIPNNGGGSDGVEINLPAIAVTNGQNILVVRDEDSTALETYFGDEWALFDHVIFDAGINFNGDDGVELFSLSTELTGPPMYSNGVANPFNGIDVGDRAAPTFADLDGDGDLDGWIGNKNGDLVLLTNSGDANAPVFAMDTVNNPFGNTYNSDEQSNLQANFDEDAQTDLVPVFADIDGDGDLDLFAGGLNGPLMYFENDAGAWTWTETNDIGIYDIGNGAIPTIADADEDGDLDVLLSKGSDVTYFRNDGSGFFDDTQGNPFEIVNEAIVDSIASALSPTFVDWNGDQHIDLFVGTQEGPIFYFENNGDATWTDMTGTDDDPFAGYSPVGEESLAFMDLDNDGDLDSFVGNKDGDLLYFENDGSGNLTQTAGPFDDVDFGGNRLFPATYDMDRDGDQDMLIGKEDGTLRTFLNDGDGTFTELDGANDPFDGIKAVKNAAPAFGDLDGDGLQDVIIGERAGNSWFFMNTGGDPVVGPTAAGSIDNQFAVENEPFTASFDAGVFSDANSPNLTYRAMKADGTALPAWLSFDRSGRTFSGTPSSANIGSEDIKVMAFDEDGNSAEVQFTLYVQLITGVELNNKANVYPNPFTDEVTIATDWKSEKSVELFTISGRRLKVLKTLDQNVQMDMTDLPKGVYVLRILSTEGTIVEQIVKE